MASLTDMTSSNSPPAYDANIKNQDPLARLGLNISPAPESKALVVELHFCAPDGITRPGYVRSGKTIRKTNDAITFTDTTTLASLNELLVSRAIERGILPPERTKKEVGAILVRPDGVRPDGTGGSLVRLDATSWEAGKALVLGRKRASLVFMCAVLEEGYREREERKAAKGERKRCVVM